MQLRHGLARQWFGSAIVRRRDDQSSPERRYGFVSGIFPSQSGPSALALIGAVAGSRAFNTAPRAASRGVATPVFRARRRGSRNMLSNSNGWPRSKSINVEAL